MNVLRAAWSFNGAVGALGAAWSAAADPCAPWAGVGCAAVSGYSDLRVVSIDVAGMMIPGSIPATLDLPFLGTLVLSKNLFVGPLPSSGWSSLSSLTVLDLGDNNFYGTIPSALSALRASNNLSLSVAGNPNLCGSPAFADAPPKMNSSGTNVNASCPSGAGATAFGERAFAAALKASLTSSDSVNVVADDPW